MQTRRQRRWRPGGFAALVAVVALAAAWLPGSAPAKSIAELFSDVSPAWSPDGTRIAFFGHGGVFVVPRAGGAPTRLADVRYWLGRVPRPAWSPDGRWIAFVKGVPLDRERCIDAACTATYRPLQFDVFVVSADGRELRRLTETAADEEALAWSPDGTRIAVTLRDVESRDRDIAVLSVADGALARVATGPRDDFSPAWSPDGRRIAFARTNRLGEGDILVMNADGTAVRRVTRNSGDDADPAWSPDGRRIAFRRFLYFEPRNAELFVVRPDGAGARRLTRTAAEETAPAWSPRGRWLVFERNGFVSVLDTSSKRARSITRGFDPVWAPNGRELAFTYAPNAGAPAAIHVARVDGSPSVQLTRPQVP